MGYIATGLALCIASQCTNYTGLAQCIDTSYVKLIASDPVLPPAVKQYRRPATTRLRNIGAAKMAQMANSDEPSHVNANSHTTNDNCAECGLPIFSA